MGWEIGKVLGKIADSDAIDHGRIWNIFFFVEMTMLSGC